MMRKVSLQKQFIKQIQIKNREGVKNFNRIFLLEIIKLNEQIFKNLTFFSLMNKKRWNQLVVVNL